MRSTHPEPCSRGRQSAHSDKRSEEHTSELQSQSNLVCRLLLEKKKNSKSTRKTRDFALFHMRLSIDSNSCIASRSCRYILLSFVSTILVYEAIVRSDVCMQSN